MNIYQKSGVWYAPNWANPATGVVVKAHSLKTGDRTKARALWTLEQAAALRGGSGAQLELPAKDSPRVSDAFSRYLHRKAGSVASATLDSYWDAAGRILLALEDRYLVAMEGEAGTRALDDWSAAEVERLGGRTHTVVKHLESIIKPALRLAHHLGWLRALPLFPELKSDYRGNQRVFFFTRDQYAALRSELPEIDVVTYRDDGARVVVYPRLWCDLAVSTGMHDSDVNRFSGADWDRGNGHWLRRNTKGAANYSPEWFPADAYLQLALEAHARRHGVPAGAWVTGGPGLRVTRHPWMRARLMSAAKRAGIVAPPGEEVSTIHFRHTFATWRKDDGWTFDETARVLGNSSGMVREVYAQVPRARFLELAQRSTVGAAQLVSMTAALEGPRKGPRNLEFRRVVATVVKPQTKESQHVEIYRKEGRGSGF